MSAEVREEVLELSTYVWGSPDPNPPFQRTANWAIYPYPLLDDIREEARPVRYRSLVVENEYLRVTVLPELGGRIYSAVDKATGGELFYRNTVVKPGLIALRGAWVSGGVEWNFPRGHTVTTVSRVDARMVEEDDGAAAIWVGNIEQIHRMSWSVGIRLRPGSRAIETEIQLTNRTSLPHPYYFWANAAVPAADDLRLVYPGTRVHTWGGSYEWPVHEGRDLARYTAFERANDVFLQDSLEDFFGVYYEDRDVGLVHVADVYESFGKKFFTWGTAEHGRMWSAALSDTDGPYCEVQSGRYVDQSTWRLMPPHWGERWTEWWYPVQGIGGLSWAGKEAAVRLANRDDAIECGVVVTRPMPGARVRMAVRDTVIAEERADLAPDRPLRVRVPHPTPGQPATLFLWDSQGREIIRYTEGQRPRTIRLREEPESRDSSPGELLRRALRAEEQADPETAWDLYERALMVDPACEEAALALGRLAIARKPRQALPRLEGVAKALPQSPAAAYYLGVALARAGRDSEAEVELRRAAQRPEFAHAARVELGLLSMRRGDWTGAAEVLGESLDYSPTNMRAHVLLAAARRRARSAREARVGLDEARYRSPLDRFALAERYFCMVELQRPRLAARCLRELEELMPAESDPWLEAALGYLAAGLLEEAAELLTWATARIPAVRDCPLAHYVLGHLLGRLGRGGEAEGARRRAGELPADLVFAHHWELEAALREALEGNPDQANTRSYLGDLLYSQGRREEALVEWRAAAESGDCSSVVHRNLALAYQDVEGDLPRAEQELRRAIAISPFDRRLYLELNEVLQRRGAPAEVRLAALDSAPESLQRRGAIAAQQAVCCIELEEWDRAIDVLATHTFHRWEMEFRMRGVYVDAYLGRGSGRFDKGDLRGARADFEKALEYPMNLRIGRPARPSDARAHWCAAVVCEALGDSAAATAHWEAAAAETHHHPGKELAIYRALGLRKLGRTEEAEALLSEARDLAQQVADMAPDDAGAQFSLGLTLKAMGRKAEAAEALRRALALEPKMARAKRLLGSDTIL